LRVVGTSDVAGVGYAVGYSSASQLSRGYRRLFGEPPGRGAERMRREPLPAE
jgi:transcriptional regulator GlxA family with amidase domain